MSASFHLCSLTKPTTFPSIKLPFQLSHSSGLKINFPKKSSYKSILVPPRLHLLAKRKDDDVEEQIEVIRMFDHIMLIKEEKSLELAKEIKKKILGGSTFQEVAEEYNVYRPVMGWVRRGQLPSKLEDAAFSASLGNIVICESDYAVHIVMPTREEELNRTVRVGWWDWDHACYEDG